MEKRGVASSGPGRGMGWGDEPCLPYTPLQAECTSSRADKLFDRGRAGLSWASRTRTAAADRLGGRRRWCPRWA